MATQDGRECSQEFLTPILIRCMWGRVGSTLLMQLLGTSAAIAFEREYPYEARVLTSLLHHVQPLASPQPAPRGWWMDDPERLWWMDPAWLGEPTVHDPMWMMGTQFDRGSFHLDSVRAIWGAYSATERSRSGEGLRYYAEKYGHYAETLRAAGIPFFFIDLVRDPRDVWASIRAFDEKRGAYGFGRRLAQSEANYLTSFAEAVRRRLDVIIAGQHDSNVHLVYYEDLVFDLATQATRLGELFRLHFDPESVEESRPKFRHHMTSMSPLRSVGRWKQELSDQELSVFHDVVGTHLVDLGYDAGRVGYLEPGQLST